MAEINGSSKDKGRFKRFFLKWVVVGVVIAIIILSKQHFDRTPKSNETKPKNTVDGALSGPATVKLLVSDAAPDAADDSYTVHQGRTLTVPAASGALANDSDADGESLSAFLISGPEHGTLSHSSDGAFVYTPFAGYVGADSFSYAASDGALSDPATVKLVVSDAAPDAAGESYTVHQGQTLKATAASGVLANHMISTAMP